jgi:hypothetical protein
MHLTTNCLSLLCCLLLSLGSFSSAPAAGRATILYDAFGNSKNLEKDWGFSVLIEYSGKKILFDTGNSSKIFAANVKAMDVDLKDLDFVLISHRHGDHTSGLSHLLKVNPKVKIYVPAELFGVFGSALPKGFYKTVDPLPASMRYFDGEEPHAFSSGSPWPEGNFVPVENTLEVAPGIFLIPTVSNVKGSLELRELTLAIDTPLGRRPGCRVFPSGNRRDSQRGFSGEFSRPHAARWAPLGENSRLRDRASRQRIARQVGNRPNRARPLHRRAGLLQVKTGLRRLLCLCRSRLSCRYSVRLFRLIFSETR